MLQCDWSLQIYLGDNNVKLELSAFTLFINLFINLYRNARERYWFLYAMTIVKTMDREKSKIWSSIEFVIYLTVQ